MPKNNVLKIQQYTPKSSDVFLFDNNIWMYMFCPLANFQKDQRQKVYSNFFNSLLSRRLPIFVNSLILSEFSNRYLRLDFDLANKNDGKSITKAYPNYKKDYVGSPRYVKTVSDLKISLSQIVKVCQKCSDDFNSINTDDIFSLFQKIGFNDSYYVYFAKNKNWIIVTDDSDFTGTNLPEVGITILTC
jgi:predicted nucleic acid-binding protein